MGEFVFLFHSLCISLDYCLSIASDKLVKLIYLRKHNNVAASIPLRCYSKQIGVMNVEVLKFTTITVEAGKIYYGTLGVAIFL